MKPLKILIVDDDKSVRMFFGISVEMFSKEILYAENGIKAIETCQNNPDIDLILMDIKMPEMDGYEATKQIRIFNKEVIIIAQSAFQISDIKEKAETIGFNDYLSKPIKKTLLNELIRKYFDN